MKIFLSSTYRDLKKERESVKQQIDKLKQTFIGMEYFPASDETPLENALKWLQRVDLVIIVIAHRYGSIDHNSGYSIVELEYREAIRLSKPILIYFKDNSVPVLPKDFEQDSTAQEKLSKFKKTLYHHTIEKFRNPDDLAAKFSFDLSNYLFEKEQWENASLPEIEKYRKFWAPFTREKLTIIVEAGKKHAHKGELEFAKNINGVFGLYELIPSLYKLEIKYTIENALYKYLNKRTNIILDGSHTGNNVTREVVNLDKVKRKLIFRNKNSRDRYTRWLESEKKEMYATEYEEGEEMYPGGPRKRIVYDYGFLAKIRNPYDETKTCLISSGNHGAGTYGCMKVLSDPRLLNKILDKAEEKDFQAVIGIPLLGSFHLEIETPEVKKIEILE